MAIDDLLNTTNDQELALDELLRKRRLGIGSGLDLLKSGLEASRSEAFDAPLLSKLAGLGVTSPIDTSRVTGKLGLNLEDILGNQKFNLQRQSINLAYNRALDRAVNAGMNRKSAEDFARQTMQDQIRRQFEGQMNEKQRQQKIRQQEIENSAFAREQDLKMQSIPDPMDEYRSAVIRIMSGMPSKLLTYYGLSGGFGGGNPNIDTTPSPGGSPDFLTMGSKFSTRIDPTTGRRF